MGDLSYAIPYRDGPGRAENLGRVLQWVREQLPEGPTLMVDADPSARFNLAASRNLGVRLATTDVVVVLDADFLLDPDATRAAVAAAADGLVHLPYSHAQMLDEQGGEIATFDWSVGGAYVTTPRAWEAVGGQDERFTGWGYEDVSMHIAHRTIHGTDMVRHTGTAVHLWHPGQPKDDPAHDAGVDLFNKYQAADGNPEALRHVMGRQ